MTNRNKIYDAWLVLEYRSGNKKALTLLVKRWHKKLCRQAYWYTKDMDLAKDIAQDCWSVIINKMDNLKDANSFGSWALSIVTRKSIDHIRKHKREFKNLEQYYDATNNGTNEDHGDNSENILTVLKKSIQRLPTDQQTVLQLFYLEEFSIKQISEVMLVPIGTVKSRLFTAREKLKTIIKQ